MPPFSHQTLVSEDTRCHLRLATSRMLEVNFAAFKMVRRVIKAMIEKRFEMIQNLATSFNKLQNQTTPIAFLTKTFSLKKIRRLLLTWC